MARPALHSTDVILDAARDALLREGPRGATIQAISAASGAPTGTLYHRFGNRDRLLIEAWLRAVRRFQEGFLAALEGRESLDAAIAAPCGHRTSFGPTRVMRGSCSRSARPTSQMRRCRTTCARRSKA